MPETIAMTPGGEVRWEAHPLADGRIYAPSLADIGELSVALVGFGGTRVYDDELSGILINDQGPLLVREEFFGRVKSWSSALRWVRGNVMLQYALDNYPGELQSGYGDMSGKAVRAPRYLGAYVGGPSGRTVVRVLMSNETEGGKTHLEQQVYDRLIRPYLSTSCETALLHSFPAYARFIDLDSHHLNAFIGEDEVVKIDVKAPKLPAFS